ncbi:MAG: hypothetical protein WCK59_01565 [Candidatus Falkowbacteria bacterium]
MVKSFLKIIILFSLVATVFLLQPVKPAQASTADNIRGLAYNSLYGYISFNCLDDDFSGRFPFTFPFTFNIIACANNNHGVNLSADNNFSGDAWNTFLGLITFTSTSTPPDGGAFRANCENSVATSTACYRELDRKIYGYMRVVSTGDWINLNDSSITPTAGITNYNDPAPGIFSGYASSSFGAISFNCTNDGSCATNNYSVEIGPTEIRQMTAPNWDSVSACANGAAHAFLKWSRRSGTQTAYQLIVSTANSTSSGVVVDTGKVSNSATQYSFTPPTTDTAYYWFLRLWDITDTVTPWRQFNTSGTKDWITDNYNRNLQRGNSATFTSYKHEFPLPQFTWNPIEIVVATTSNSFISNSSYYTDANVMQTCSSGSVCSYLWSVSDAGAVVSNPTSPSTSIMFTRATNTVVTLSSTDDDIYTCSTSTMLNVNFLLPTWKEVKAQ